MYNNRLSLYFIDMTSLTKAEEDEACKKIGRMDGRTRQINQRADSTMMIIIFLSPCESSGLVIRTNASVVCGV